MLQNAAVVGTVIGVFILYIPLCIWCRRVDKKDAIKVKTMINSGSLHMI